MSTAGAPAPPTVVADAWAEMVASLANMVESGLTGDGLTGNGLTGNGLTGAETAVGRAGQGAVGADAVEVVADDPGRVEGERGASGNRADCVVMSLVAPPSLSAANLPQAITRTLAACGPLVPCTTSNSTLWPSSRVLYPVPVIALKWTKTSGPPSTAMKPYPFSWLYHFTVP
jgi:hypothetical protein